MMAWVSGSKSGQVFFCTIESQEAWRGRYIDLNSAVQSFEIRQLFKSYSSYNCIETSYLTPHVGKKNSLYLPILNNFHNLCDESQLLITLKQYGNRMTYTTSISHSVFSIRKTSIENCLSRWMILKRCCFVFLYLSFKVEWTNSLVRNC